MSGRATRHVYAHAVEEGARVMAGVVSTRRLCLGCGLRRPRFRYHDIVKTDADHTLCFQCYRALREHVRAIRLASGSWLVPLGSPATRESSTAPPGAIAA